MCLHRSPNAIDVYWVDSRGRRNNTSRKRRSLDHGPEKILRLAPLPLRQPVQHVPHLVVPAPLLARLRPYLPYCAPDRRVAVRPSVALSGQPNRRIADDGASCNLAPHRHPLTGPSHQRLIDNVIQLKGS